MLRSNRLSGLVAGGSSRVLAIANEAHKNGEAGFTVGQQAIFVGEDNSASMNHLSGIIAQGEAQVMMAGSTCINNRQSGILAREEARVDADRSVCHGNGLLGVALQGKTVNSIEALDASHNEHAGLGVYENASAVLAGKIMMQENWHKLTQEEKRTTEKKECAFQSKSASLTLAPSCTLTWDDVQLSGPTSASCRNSGV